MIAWAPWIALISAAACCALATLYLALTTVPRGAVEDRASVRNDPQFSGRLSRVLDDYWGHARVVSVLLAPMIAIFVAATVVWFTELRAGDAVELRDALWALPVAATVLWLVVLVVPMSIAAHAGAKVIIAGVLPLRALWRVLAPFRWMGAVADEIVRRLAGAERKDAAEQVQEEIMSVIEEGEARGAIDEDEREMIESVVRFSDLTVAKIMTPRTEIEAMELTNNLGEITRITKQLGHSRIPVYEESLDHIIGIFYLKDLMHWLGGGSTGKAFELKSILRPAYFIPETKTVRELLKELMEKKVHIALVADEYGGTAGLVTIEDIVEEIFGDIKDEYEAPATENPDVVLKPADRSAEIDAAARVVDVNDALTPLGVQIPDSEEYDTVGGFVGATLGRIPVKGEKFQHERMEFTVIEAKPNRVLRVGLKVREEEVVGAGSEQGA